MAYLNVYIYKCGYFILSCVKPNFLSFVIDFINMNEWERQQRTNRMWVFWKQGSSQRDVIRKHTPT